jgi:hypothetical protein
MVHRTRRFIAVYQSHLAIVLSTPWRRPSIGAVCTWNGSAASVGSRVDGANGAARRHESEHGCPRTHFCDRVQMTNPTLNAAIFGRETGAEREITKGLLAGHGHEPIPPAAPKSSADSSSSMCASTFPGWSLLTLPFYRRVRVQPKEPFVPALQSLTAVGFLGSPPCGRHCDQTTSESIKAW